MRCSFAPGSKAIECDNGAAPSSPSREFIYGNGELLATVSGGATTYYQSDHLSVRMTTDSSGNILGQQGHFPFGEAWYSSSGNTEWMFTTYQHDQETGLEYALARYYDPRTATFCSADPVEGNPSDPESWNRYVYARDNPVNLTDPSGQFWLWHALEFIGMVVADVLSGGSAQLAFEAGNAGLADIFGLESWLSFAETVHTMSQEGRQKRQGQLPPPLRLPQKAPPETPCKANIYVMLGNPKTIGKQGGIPHRTVQADSADVDPAQWGGRTGKDLESIAGQTHGTIDTSGRTVTFGNIGDVIGARNVTTINPTTGARVPVRGDAARQVIDARHPGTITVELPGLNKYPGRPNGREVYPGTIYVPQGHPCPQPR